MKIGRSRFNTLWFLVCGLCATSAVAAPNLSLGFATQAVPGQTVTIPVNFSNDATVAGVQFDVQYNAAVLNVGSAQVGSVLMGTGQGVSSTVVAANAVRVVVSPTSDNAVLNAGEVALIPWTVSSVAGGGIVPLTISNVIFTDRSAKSVTAGTIANGAIGIDYAPVATNLSFTTNEDQPLSATLSATDNDGNPLTYSVVSNGSRGTAVITNAGAFTYTPSANANGTDSFTYKVSDGKLNSNVATVTLNITPVNDAPVLGTIGSQSMNEGATKTIALSATDVDSSDTLSFSVTGLPLFATFTDNGNRTASISLAPDYSAAGSYNMTVTVTDNGAPILSDSKSFALTVNNVNVPPTANAGPDQTVNGGAAVTLIGSGSDSDGTISSYAWTQVSGAAVTLNGANTATASFTAPAVTSTTTLTFQLTVTDNNGATANDQVVITVKPTGKPDLVMTAVGSPLTAVAGANIAITNTVTNSGTAAAEGNFDVGLYLIPEPVLFASTFESGTLEGWATLKTGTIAVVTDAVDGNVLKKSAKADPNGGKALLSSSVSDFELTVYTKRLTLPGSNANRYSLSDSSGNGYGFYLNFSDGKLYLEKRAAWTTTTAIGTAAPLTGGAVLNQWYTLQLTKQGTQLIAKAYLGKVIPATATPIATVSATNSTYTTFTQVNINGGYDYYTDNVQVLRLMNVWPTDSSEIFLGKRVVYSLSPGATSVDSTSLTIPAGTAARTYAIGVKADMYSVITESNETNNLLFGNRQFVITGP